MNRLYKKMQKIRLRNKILLFNSLIILLSTTIFVVAGNQLILDISFDKAKKQADREVFLIGNSMDLAISSMVDYVINTSLDNRLIENLDVYANGKSNYYALNKIVTTVVNEKLGITDLVMGSSIIAKNGDVFNMSPFPREEISYIVRELEMENDLTNEKVRWFGPKKIQHYSGLDEEVLIIKKNIVDLYNPQYLGTIYMFVNTEVFMNIYNVSLDVEENRYMLLDENGKVLSKNFVAEKGLNPNNYHIIERPLEAEKWKLVSGIALSTYYETYKGYIILLLMFAIIQLALSMGLAIFMSKSTVKPVQALVDIMGEIQKGNRKVRANLVVSDELHLLQTTFNQLMDSNDELIEQVYETQNNLRKYEMMLLQAQIKPHFLYNALGTIVSFIKLDMKEEAIEALNSLARFFRVSLSEGSEAISLFQELELVRNYLIIQRYRYIDVMDFHIDVEEKLYHYIIPKITLQPIVENAIYHGIKPKDTKEKSSIVIKAEEMKGVLYIHVIDNGVGMYPGEVASVMDKIDDVHAETHFGLRSVHHRLKLMYGDIYGVSIQSEKNKYTDVTIMIPTEELGRINT